MNNIINTCHNVLSPSVLKEIKAWVFGGNTPYYPVNTDYYTLTHPSEYSHAWEHTALFDGRSVSVLGDMLHIASLSALDTAKINVDKIFKIQVSLGSIGPQSFRSGPSVSDTYPHKIAMLFINDSDGDVEIYNEKYDPSSYEKDIYK